MKKPWNTTCSACNDPNAYQGFMVCECTNYKCKFYSETQRDLVDQYKRYLVESELKNTIPTSQRECDENGFYVSSTYVSKDKDDTDDPTTVPYGISYASGYDPNGYYSNQNQSLNDDVDDSCVDPDYDLNDLFGIP